MPRWVELPDARPFFAMQLVDGVTLDAQLAGRKNPTANLPHFLAATTCLLARAEETTPRTVLERFFRRSASDDAWRDRYLPLFQ